MTQALAGVRGITFDFGNTLVRADRSALAEVVARLATHLVAGGAVSDTDAFVAAWAAEQARQFREEVPQLREVDLAQRLARVLARLRGMGPPADDARWDDAAAGRLSDQAEIAAAIEAYSLAFVELVPPLPGTTALLRGLHRRGHALAILSNWPSAVTVDRVAERAGWVPFLTAIVVSQRVGAIKPSAVIFRAAEEALAIRPPALLHVGDDWAQDVVGAKSAGWRAAYLRDRQGDTPLPTSTPGDGVAADLVLDDLAELPALLA